MFGENNCGQLGIGEKTNEFSCVHSPKLVPFFKKQCIKIVQVAACADNTLFLSEHGYVYSTGSNLNGQLGISDVSSVYTPVFIEKLKDVKIVKVACGFNFSLFLSGIKYFL